MHADQQQHQLMACHHSAGMIDLFNSTACLMLLHMPCRLRENLRHTSCHSKQAQLSKGLKDTYTCPVLDAQYTLRLRMQAVKSFSASLRGDDSLSKLL